MGEGHSMSTTATEFKKCLPETVKDLPAMDLRHVLADKLSCNVQYMRYDKRKVQDMGFWVGGSGGASCQDTEDQSEACGCHTGVPVAHLS